MIEHEQPSIETTTRRMVAINRIMDGILEMRSPEGSEKYKHGQLQFNLGRLDSAVLGMNPNVAIDKAQERVREYDELQAHQEADHRLKVQEDRDTDWKVIRGEFPNQFEEFEEQAKQGDVPARMDAGGFEMRRRGW